MTSRLFITRAIVPALLLALGVAACPEPAPAATPAASATAKPSVRLSDRSVRPGQRLRVSGRAFPAHTRVRLRLAGRSVALARTGRRGTFSVTFRLARPDAGRRRLTIVAGRTRLARTITVAPRRPAAS
ncbi:MAG: hypothetical protein AVDCRST_MAG65-244, partial [uncultured Solirubrobacteraceae bacterium]